MARIELSVVVTAHDEGLIAGPTMRSGEAAIAAAEAAGVSVERMVLLDRPSEGCRTFFAQPALSHWRVREVDFGDPYLTRNAGVVDASGEWIAFLDGDDLISENWLAKAAARLRQAEADGERVIVHPELNWIFEGASSVFSKIAQDDPLFLPHYFYFDNYYDMMCMAPRHAALEMPYDNRDIENGFGYQDWQWNIETMGAGWRHVVVRDTVIFKRRRAGSVSSQNRDRRAVIRSLEPMAIDKVMRLAKPDG